MSEGEHDDWHRLTDGPVLEVGLPAHFAESQFGKKLQRVGEKCVCVCVTCPPTYRLQFCDPQTTNHLNGQGLIHCGSCRTGATVV